MSLDAISNKLLLSIIYTIETDDFEGFSNLFLPSYGINNQEKIEQYFSKIKGYYKGNALGYASQLTENPASRDALQPIENIQKFNIKTLNTSEASLYQQYYIKTNQSEYLITYSWIQDENKSSGLTAIYIVAYGIGIF